MITIDWKILNGIGQEYVDRLISWANKHERSYLYAKIVDKINTAAFRDLILCPPYQLQSYSPPSGLIVQAVSSSYNSFFSSEGTDGENNAIWLMRKMNIKVCPYCNRTYTFTLKRRKGIRPEFDHFYPKSTYKHLALSFYNLIPSCPSCNHRKSNTIFDFHPYFGMLVRGELPPKIHVVEDKVEYDKTGHPVLFPEKPEIRIDNPNKNTTRLCLDELYEHHSDYAKEILDKILAYNAAYYEPLISAFHGMGRTPEEIDRLIWGNYIEEAQQTRRPLSKLTRDIL